VLALICVALAVLATVVIPELAALVAPIAGANPVAALVPDFFHGAPQMPASIATDLSHIGTGLGAGVLPFRSLAVLHSGGKATPVVFAMSTALTFAVVAFVLFLVWLASRVLGPRRRVVRRRLWDAGLARLRPEMTYNATGFAAPVRTLFNTLLRPVVTDRVERQGAFATIQRRESTMGHIVDRLTLRPLLAAVRQTAAWLAAMHHGRISAYAGYVVAALVVALLAMRAVLH
jgi:hydrogenase-4 component B